MLEEKVMTAGAICNAVNRGDTVRLTGNRTSIIERDSDWYRSLFSILPADTKITVFLEKPPCASCGRAYE